MILSYFHLTQEAILIYAMIIVVDTVLAILSKYRSGMEITSKDRNDGVSVKVTRLITPFIIAIMANVAGFSPEYIA